MWGHSPLAFLVLVLFSSCGKQWANSSSQRTGLVKRTSWIRTVCQQGRGK